MEVEIGKLDIDQQVPPLDYKLNVALSFPVLLSPRIIIKISIKITFLIAQLTFNLTKSYNDFKICLLTSSPQSSSNMRRERRHAR